MANAVVLSEITDSTTYEEFIGDHGRVNRLMDGVYARGDRYMFWLVGLHLVLTFAFAAIYQTWFLSIVVGGVAAAMFFMTVRALPRHRLTRIVAGISLQTYVALHIYQLHGLPEIHFFFFTAFTAMIVYQDGNSMWPGTILIILQHILFAVLQNTGVNLYFFEDPYITIRKLAFHFSIAILQVVLCGLWTKILRKQTIVAAFQQEKLKAAQVTRERDMKARYELERARTRAEDSAKAKGEFLATMSHEMRTPLNGILGMSDLLSRTALATKQAEHVETLRTCADNLLVLVNDVLDLSRIEAGRMVVEVRSCEIRALVDEVLTVNAARAVGKNVELCAVVMRNVPESILGDETRIRQTLTNLVANAVKFTDEGEIEIRVSAARGKLTFSVRDTGIGIDPTIHDALFSPFTQADPTITRRFGGSGLGLAVSKRLVQVMGGVIGFESVLGEGSRFHFRLPLKEGEPTGRVMFAGRRAFVIAPHPITRLAIVEALAASGMDVADSATDADVVVTAGLSIAERETLARTVDPRTIVSIGSAGEQGDALTPWPVRSGLLLAAVGTIVDPVAAAVNELRHDVNWKAKPGRRVLVVEDNPVNQIVAQAMLEDLGVMVAVAEGGETALQMLDGGAFDLVLMDCQMPGLDGWETTRRIRASETDETRIPIIALTAQALAGDEERCRDAGMDDYLTKPIERRKLVAKLIQTFTGKEVVVPPAPDSGERSMDDDRAAITAFLDAFGEGAGARAGERLVDAFVESIPEQVRRLRTRGDSTVVAAAAHVLLGATRSVGLASIAGRLAELEKIAAVDATRSRKLITEVEARLGEVCEELGSRGAAKLAQASA